ncbi:MAG: PD40 domain-containing protein [Actinobacteria bacterium]|nr:PD40 domain-containing protein [Actinomycetota bacterium]
MRKGFVVFCVVVSVTFLCVSLAGAAGSWVTFPGDYRTLLASRGGGAQGPAAAVGATEPSISLDGGLIGFTSAAPGLGPTAGHAQVFLRTYHERCTAGSCACCTRFAAGGDRTILVSRADGMTGAPAAGESGEAALAGAGWKVAFTSEGANLGGLRGVKSVYLRDTRSGSTVLVSRASGPHGAPANGASSEPSVSHDGNLVAFTSTATNLGGPTDGSAAVYVRDLTSERTFLVSRSSSGAVADAPASEPSLAPGGGSVAFSSAAGNLGSGTPAGVTEVWLRGLGGGGTTLVSRAPGAGGAPANAAATHPSVDQTGDRVAFQSAATNLGPAARVENVWLRDLAGGETALMSRGFKHHMVPGVPANAASTLPSLSRDGRFVCFQSAASNLGSAYGGEPRPGVENVFVHDTRSLDTILISRASGRGGAAADGNSSEVSCSAGASLAAFSSRAGNLGGGAPAGVGEIYRRTIFGGR